MNGNSGPWGDDRRQAPRNPSEVWDEETRRVVLTVVREMWEAFGCPPDQHGKDHANWRLIEPWALRRMEAEEKRAEFWSALRDRLAGGAVEWLLRIICVLIGLGVYTLLTGDGIALLDSLSKN